MSAILKEVQRLGDENTTALKNLAKEDTGLSLHPEKDQFKIPLEEFLYFANIQREAEQNGEFGQEEQSAIPGVGLYKSIKGKMSKTPESTSSVNEKDTLNNDASSDTTEGLVNANRALRTAGWLNVFYLITTDILGPTGAPYAISQMGFVPGALLYTLLGVCAAYTGFLLWRMFLRLDSAHYPLKTYGELVGRVFGKGARYGVDILQSVQLLCNVAVIILGNGQGLSQIAKGKVCSSVLIVIWAFAGMFVGQIKSLQRFGFIANLAVWMNLFVVFATMGIVVHSGPNIPAAMAQNPAVTGIAPVVTKAVVSGSGNFSAQLNATMNIVYAYGGAMVFINFMAEMRRPWDFWKGMALAQTVIFVCYLLFGLFVYAYQGQFVVNPANQGIPGGKWYGWQTALNVISLVSALIAAGLYGNVGIKVVYNTFIKGMIRGPELDTTKGRIVWVILVIVYWALAYVVASAIPEFSALVGLVGAVCILQFTYTFPPIIAFGFDLQTAALEDDGPYDPISKQTNRIDSWSSSGRWVRAYKKNFWMNTFHILFFLAGLATAALGIYGSAMSLKAAFQGTQTTSFGCQADI